MISSTLSRPASPGPAQPLWRDPVLRIAFLVVGMLIAYQLAATLIQPHWGSAVTDWFRAILAWPEMLLVVFVSVWLTRTHHPGALSACLLSGAMLSYTTARNLWTVYDRFIYPDHVPFPAFPDLFFVLQYPFFILALALLPGVPPWGPRLKVILDCMLLMGAATAVSWYFVLAPVYLESGEPAAGKVVNLAYPIGDLCVLFGLTVALIYRKSRVERPVLALLITAVICLMVADSWAAWLLLYPSHTYRTGNPPDLFWSIFYLLVPLALLVQLRIAQSTPIISTAAHVESADRQPYEREDFKEVIRVLSPFVAALLACAIIAVRAIIAPMASVHPVVPTLIIFGLLLLVMVRQGVTVLDNAQLRRKWIVALAHEQSLRETNRRMEAFLGIAGHELKTPLTTVILSLQLLARRAQHRAARTGGDAGQAQPEIQLTSGDLELPLQQAERLNRLVRDLLDTSRIREGRLELDLKFVELGSIVGMIVAEQRQAFPGRVISLDLPEVPVSVLADADRIGQVVTNYLVNALKYSQEDRPVEVGVQVMEQQVRVWVRDQGPGLSSDEQVHIWERFYRAPGVEIQSGSGIGLGLGLHISRTIVEQHHGQVGVESAPGEGSTFWFSLPLAVPEERWRGTGATQIGFDAPAMM